MCVATAPLVRLAAVMVLMAACGGQPDEAPADSAPEAVTPSPSVPTTSTPEQEAGLESYRYVMSLSVVPNVGETPRLVAQLAGEATTSPPAARISGDLFGEPVALVTDGELWWGPDYPAGGVEDGGLFLLYNGFLQPTDIARLLDDEAAWGSVGLEDHLGLAVEHLVRRNIVGGRDWDYGDLASLDVWRDDSGEVVRLAALFATGDNDGWPLAAWEITERNPEVAITIPGAG